MDRHAPRDLYDLWALAERGLIDGDALEVFVAQGPTGKPPQAWVFDADLDEAAWRHALSHQTPLRVTAAEAVERRHPAHEIATTGVVAGGAFNYIANAQLGRLRPDGGVTAAATPVPSLVLRLPLGGACGR